ncbi:MAG: rRNA methyltransferase [Clostridia bacterium]|nr:rRNA methyltransferase [Clostridia bacterium]
MAILKMSVRNAAFQKFETLQRNREKRTKEKLFFVEGVHPIEQAVAAGWEFEAIGFAAGKRLSGWAMDMRSKARAETEYEILPELMAELSNREEPCELIALVRQRTDGLQRMAEKMNEKSLIVLFDRPQNPGNLGTVIRSADAFGADGLIITGHGADFYDPQCVRATIGALFHMPVAAMASADEALSWVNGLSVRPTIVGTSAKGECLISDIDMTGPTILVIGNETFGMSKAWKAGCDRLAKIPIYGAASSLNVGCAASICLYEIARQRGFLPPEGV